MEEEKMTIKIIGMIIGAAVLAAGIYYRVKEKNDPESKKIYTIVSAVGAIVLAASLLLLIFGG